MNRTNRKCFVQQFQLRSPIEEFEDFSSAAIQRAEQHADGADAAAHREAAALVLRKLRPEWSGNDPSAAKR